MYVPKDFVVEDRAQLSAFIERHPFGTVVSDVRGRPFATHLPMIASQNGDELTLALHVARANPQWETIEGQEVLAIFQGAHAMVSASWYEHPPSSVPTWDYAAVHCNGVAHVLDGSATRRVLEQLVGRLETSWRIEQADSEFISRLERAIVGVEIAVTRCEGAFKYSQNRSAEDRARVLAALSRSSKSGDRELLEEMRATLR